MRLHKRSQATQTAKPGRPVKPALAQRNFGRTTSLDQSSKPGVVLLLLPTSLVGFGAFCGRF